MVARFFLKMKSHHRLRSKILANRLIVNLCSPFTSFGRGPVFCVLCIGDKSLFYQHRGTRCFFKNAKTFQFPHSIVLAVHLFRATDAPLVPSAVRCTVQKPWTPVTRRVLAVWESTQIHENCCPRRYYHVCSSKDTLYAGRPFPRVHRRNIFLRLAECALEQNYHPKPISCTMHLPSAHIKPLRPDIPRPQYPFHRSNNTITAAAIAKSQNGGPEYRLGLLR